MRLNLLSVLGLFIPTFCIFYSFSWCSLPPLRPYHENFGNRDYYLDVYYDLNPQGLLIKDLPTQKITFEGYLASAEQEEKVKGYRLRSAGHSIYVFESREGKFIGMLARADQGGCEPTLRFQIDRPDARLKSGVMTAGFCP